jgi:hypothetical protein
VKRIKIIPIPGYFVWLSVPGLKTRPAKQSAILYQTIVSIGIPEPFDYQKN